MRCFPRALGFDMHLAGRRQSSNANNSAGALPKQANTPGYRNDRAGVEGRNYKMIMCGPATLRPRGGLHRLKLSSLLATPGPHRRSGRETFPRKRDGRDCRGYSDLGQRALAACDYV